MGAYVLWLEENGLEGMEHVERYHKENPHMIPNPRQVGQWQDYSDLVAWSFCRKEEDG